MFLLVAFRYGQAVLEINNYGLIPKICSLLTGDADHDSFHPEAAGHDGRLEVGVPLPAVQNFGAVANVVSVVHACEVGHVTAANAHGNVLVHFTFSAVILSFDLKQLDSHVICPY